MAAVVDNRRLLILVLLLIPTVTSNTLTDTPLAGQCLWGVNLPYIPNAYITVMPCSIQYKCNSGFVPRGNGRLAMVPSGQYQWLDGVQFACTRVSCPVLPAVANGRWVQVDKPNNTTLPFEFESKYELQCKGLLLNQGVAWTSCMADGTWQFLDSPNQPKCVSRGLESCGWTQKIPNAYQLGENALTYTIPKVWYECRPGYIPQGVNMLKDDTSTTAELEMFAYPPTAFSLGCDATTEQWAPAAARCVLESG